MSDELRAAIIDLWRRHEAAYPAGGALHIVTDDGNVNTGHVEWCRDKALAAGDYIGFLLCVALLLITEEERAALWDEAGREPWGRGL